MIAGNILYENGEFSVGTDPQEIYAKAEGRLVNGTPGGIRTPGLLLRRQLLYPTELLAQIFRAGHICRLGRKRMERVMGIEPTCSAWKADILPLNYTRRLFTMLT